MNHQWGQAYPPNQQGGYQPNPPANRPQMAQPLLPPCTLCPQLSAEKTTALENLQVKEMEKNTALQKLAKKEQAYSDLKSQKDFIANTVRIRERQYEALNSQLTQQINLTSDCQNVIKKHKETIAQTEKAVGTRNATIRDLKREVEEVKAECEVLKGAIGDLEEKLAGKEKSQGETIAGLEAHVEGLDRGLAAAEESIDGNISTIKGLGSRNEALEEKLAKAEAAMVKMSGFFK